MPTLFPFTSIVRLPLADGYVYSLRFSELIFAMIARASGRWAGMLVVLLVMGSLNVSAEILRPRLIVLADIGHDPDEEQQLVHLLACANQFELEGLIAVTGRFFRPDPTDSTKWLQPHLFHELIDGYTEVYPNLKTHGEDWPTPKQVRTVVANGQTGNGMMDVGEGRWSRGARLIAAAAE